MGTTIGRIVVWWLWVLIIGGAAWPLAWRLFPRFPDRGYALSKALGLLLWGYILWLGSTLGVLHNTFGGALVALGVVLLLSYVLARDAWTRTEGSCPALVTWWRGHRSSLVYTELLFLLAYLGWAYVRAQSPDIATAGGEKFMEIAFINGILTSRVFPPHDPWLAGYAISYYYFGYVMIGGLIQLSHVPPSVAFNLAGATWFALTVTTAYGVMRGFGRLTRSRLWGLLAALVVALMGNLEGVLEVLYARRVLPVGFWRWLDIRSINVPYNPNEPASWIPHRFIWWWQASRVLHDKDLLGNTMEVIDEFPAFSFILGDMHPHVLALPFVLLTIGFALTLFQRDKGRLPAEETPGSRWARWRAVVESHFPRRADGVLYALALGGLAFLNTWDFPIYLALVMGVIALREAYDVGHVDWEGVGRAVGVGALLAVLGVLLYLPFYIGFQSQAGGILPNLFNPTRFSQFFVMFGPLLVMLFLFVWLHRGERSGRWKVYARWLLGVWLLPWVILASIVFLFVVTPAGQTFLRHVFENPQVQANIGGRGGGQLLLYILALRLRVPWTFLILGGGLAWALCRLVQFPWDGDEEGASAFALLLIALGLLLTYAVEFVYIKDLFNTRMNTVFKFYFQAWVLWALAGVYALALAARRLRGTWRLIALSVPGVFIALGLVYTLLAIPARSELKQAGVTLNGEAWVAKAFPDDYAGIVWVREHTAPEDIILESPGGSYSFHGRVAAFTGRATLMGWDFHELQWRGAALNRQAGSRAGDIERIYKSARGPELVDMLRRYGVKYLIVGSLERQKYGIGQARERVFESTLDPVFAQGSMRIYRRPR